MNLSDVIIELDAKALVDALNNPVYTNYAISLLFDDCRQLPTQIPQIIFRHIYREANLCANRLANYGRLQDVDFVIYSNMPVDLLSFVEVNCQGMYSNRICPDALSFR